MTGQRPPAVLQILPALGGGGVERGTVEVAAALVAAGWQAFVASSGGALVHELQKVGAVHLTLPLAAKNPLVMQRNVGRLVEAIRRHRIDIVHARSRAPAWSAWAASRRTGRHFVTTFHNVYGHGTRLRRWYNSVMARGERVIAISDFVAAHAADAYGVGTDRLRTIHRGVDLRRFDPERVSAERLVRLARDWRLPDDAPVVMLPGRLTAWKGQIELVEAMAGLARSDAVCVLVGAAKERGRYRHRVEREIAARGLEGRFRIVDHCDDMPAAYMLAEIVVSASNRPEGFGRVVVEAQAMGRPVVATDHGGARETVLNGITGWLVPPADPRALAAVLAAGLALDAEDRAALAARARSHVAAHFTTEAMCTRTLAVYEEVLFPAADSGAVPQEAA